MSSPENDGANSALSEVEKAKLYVDVWKQTVEVQKHFNDLAWRIRGLALTAATFALGASALATRDGTTIGGFSLGAIVLLAGVLLWHAFYFADRYWYHPLLIASVKHGEQLETELRELLPKVGLTLDITEGSPSKAPVLWFWRRKELHSSDKLLYFYVIGGAVLVLAALLLQVASWRSGPSTAVDGTPSTVCCVGTESPASTGVTAVSPPDTPESNAPSGGPGETPHTLAPPVSTSPAGPPSPTVSTAP